jgi:hypothetical protein
MQILFFLQQNRSKFGPDVIYHNRRPGAFYFGRGFTFEDSDLENCSISIYTCFCAIYPCKLFSD